jgi:hypothetical protein
MCFTFVKYICLAKLEPKDTNGIFVGYAVNSHAYRVHNKFTICVEESSNVEFDKDNASQVEKNAYQGTPLCHMWHD